MAIALPLLSFSPVSQSDPGRFALAEAAYALGDIKQAASIWLDLAEQGDDQAQLYVAYLYRHGRGLPKSTQQSLHWYRKAAEQGEPNAQYQVGLMHELGMGVRADASEAEYWYGLAIAQDFCPGELSAGGALGDD